MSQLPKAFLQRLALLAGLIVVAFFVHENLQHTNNESIFGRAWQFLREVLSGHLGYTLDGRPLLSEFLERLPSSLILLVLATMVAWAIGLPLAVTFAAQKYRQRRRHAELITGILMSLPVFWIGQILLMTVATQAGWLPLGGELSWVYEVPSITGVALIDTMLSHPEHKWEIIWDAITHLVLPVSVMALAPTAYLLQEFGAQMERISQMPFILVAKARGITQRQLIWGHLLPNAMFPVLKGLQVQFALLVSNLIIVETLFLWPGVGSWLVELVKKQETQTIPGLIILFGIFVLVLNSITELLQHFWDPERRRL